MSEAIEQPAEGLWSGLRRRKVVQWGIAYVAAAWGLLQGLAYLSTVFQWPAQLQRPVTMAFALPGGRRGEFHVRLNPGQSAHAC